MKVDATKLVLGIAFQLLVVAVIYITWVTIPSKTIVSWIMAPVGLVGFSYFIWWWTFFKK